MIATGTTPEVTTWPTTRGATDEAELRKRLWAHLLAGTRMIALDNVPTGLDSATLAAILTAETYADRTLGGSTVPSCPVRCVWAATGLNPTLTGELARRAISIRLEPSEEAPWERQGWRHADLLGWCREHRGELVWAALVLWRAWLAAGRPRWTEQTMGSYAAWSETMGGVLEVAGIPGLLGNRQDMWQATETELPELRALVENWWEEHGEAQVEVRDLIQLCRRRRILVDLLQGRRDKTKALGRLLRQHSGRVVDVGSLRLQMRLSGMTRTRTNLWRLARPLPAPNSLQQKPIQDAIHGQQQNSPLAHSLHDSLQAEPLRVAKTKQSAGIAGSHVTPPAREENIHGNRHGVDHSLQCLHPTQKPRQDANQTAGSGAGSAQGVEGSLPAKPAWMAWNQREQEQLEGLL